MYVLILSTNFFLDFYIILKFQAKILDLSWNELNSINSTKLENLKVQNLNLSHNKIQEIKLYNLVDLKVLDASHNEINNAEDVSIKNSTIEEINLSGNHIKSLKNLIFEQNRKLKVLDLSHNEISVISNLSSESIQILYLNNNHLHYIKRQSLIELVNLKKLILTDNKRLYTLNRSNKFLILEELKILDASHCGLTKLDVNGFPKLEILYLSYNNISKIASDSFKFSVLLVTIDLSFNSIDYFETDSFLKNENLKFLNLRGNKIIDLAWTVHLQTVGLLNLSHNCVTNILNLNLTKVKILDLSNNKIEKLMTDFDVALPNIVDFNLKSNRIKEIIQLKSRTLQILNLASCKIINVDENAFREVDTLEKLTLSDNKVKNLKFVKHLLHLKELNLDENAWECRCKDRDQTELFENENITLLDDVVCVPDGLTWLEFCEREEKAEIKKIQELNSLTLGDGVQKSSVEPGWVAGGVSILLIIITVSGWMFYRKRSRDKRLTK